MPCCSSSRLAAEKCLQPRNPRCADSGDGCGAFSRWCRSAATCAAFGVDAIIVDKKNFNQKSFVCIKSASGAIENINIIETSNIKNDIKFLKKKDFWIYALSSKAINSFHKENFNKKKVFIFGSEEKGLKNNTLKLCDNILKIDIDKKTESLNVANAVSACLYGLRVLNNI